MAPSHAMACVILRYQSLHRRPAVPCFARSTTQAMRQYVCRYSALLRKKSAADAAVAHRQSPVHTRNACLQSITTPRSAHPTHGLEKGVRIICKETY